MFQHARLKLTAWYLVIIMTISLLFSGVIYARVNSDLTRFEKMQIRFHNDLREGRIREMPGQQGPQFTVRLEAEEIHEARTALLTILGIINFSILVVAGGAGYFLAGKTLRPIKQMMEEQKRFVSDSSHELRTPLTSLRSEIEVALRNKSLSIAEAKKVLESNLEEVISLQTLSNNLLELAQNGKTINKSSMETISVKELIQSAIKKTESSARLKNIKIENQAKDIKVNGIPDRLREVFIILIDNAIKYSPNKSKVKIQSKKVKSKIEISVTNQGMGINEEDLPYIFDRFYRSDKSRSEEGYGLGLSIAKKIIEAHGGSIQVKSIPGKLTSFTFSLSSS